MATHQFGLIENSLIVGYYSRGGFHPNRVSLCKGKAVVFHLKSAESDPFYNCTEVSPLFTSNKRKGGPGFEVKVKCTFDFKYLWNFIDKKRLGYQLTFTLKDEPTDIDCQATWPIGIVEILNKEGSIRNSFTVLQSEWGTLLGIKRLKSFLSRFPKTKQVQVIVTRDCVAVWADGQLRQQP